MSQSTTPTTMTAQQHPPSGGGATPFPHWGQKAPVSRWNPHFGHVNILHHPELGEGDDELPERFAEEGMENLHE